MLARLRTKFSEISVSVGQGSSRLAYGAKLWFAPPVLYSIALAAAIWTHKHISRVAEMNTNKLAEPERLGGLKTLAFTLLGMAVFYGGAVVVRRIITGAWRGAETAGALRRWLSFLLAAPLVAALRAPKIEVDTPKLALVFAGLAAVACIPTLSAIAEVFERGPARVRDAPEPPGWTPARLLGPIAIVLLWIAYGWFFSRLAIINHHAMNSRITDLGYYDNIFYQSAHGNPLGCSFIKTGNHASAHFDPVLIVLSPLYLIYPRAEFLLVFQSVWLGAGVIPIYLLAVDKLGSRVVAVLLAAAWVLYPALHGANMYEFHSLTLISPLVLWLLYFLETGATRKYWAMLFVLLIVREDVSLLMCFVGLYQILTRKPGSAFRGAVTIGVSLVYFVILKKFFMPSDDLLNAGKESYGFAYYYDAMIPNKTGAAGLLTSIITNPVFTLKNAIDEPKVQFLLLLFLPLAFLPLYARTARVMLVYGLVFCLLASRAAVFAIHFQYSSLLFGVAFGLTPIALARIVDRGPSGALGVPGARLARALGAVILIATALVSWKFGGIVDNGSFRGGFVKVTRELTPAQVETYAWVREQAATIPRRVSVAATPKMGPHISNRKLAFFYPEKAHADYLFLDESELKAADADRHKKLLEKGTHVEVSRHGTMVLIKKK